MLRLMRACWQLLADLWFVDRIRVSPVQGQLRRLSPETILIVDKAPYRICTRRIAWRRGRSCLEYSCHGHTERALLRVFSSVNHSSERVEWQTRTELRVYDPNQIGVFDARDPGVQDF